MSPTLPRLQWAVPPPQFSGAFHPSPGCPAYSMYIHYISLHFQHPRCFNSMLPSHAAIPLYLRKVVLTANEIHRSLSFSPRFLLASYYLSSSLPLSLSCLKKKGCRSERLPPRGGIWVTLNTFLHTAIDPTLTPLNNQGELTGNAGIKLNAKNLPTL